MISVGHFKFGDLGARCAEFGERRLVSGLEDRVRVGLLRAFDRRFLEFERLENYGFLTVGHCVGPCAAGCRVAVYGGFHACYQEGIRYASDFSRSCA